MTRIAIIDHTYHTLWVEDITDGDLELFNNDEQAYIEANYELGDYSWDYITDAEYITADNDDPLPIDFESML